MSYIRCHATVAFCSAAAFGEGASRAKSPIDNGLQRKANRRT